MLYTNFIRPLLFRLPPEAAHDLAKATLKVGAPWAALAGAGPASPRLRCRLGGLTVDNPIGLSAGFDKNAEALAGLSQLGLGYIIVGSILPAPRTGNPKPRLLRLEKEESLLNCYGLPSHGLQRCLARLERWSRGPRKVPVIANIDCPDVDTYAATLARIEPFVSAVEIGTQCPNNRDDHGEFNTRRPLEQLLGKVAKTRSKPLFVKLLAYNNEKERQDRLELAEVAAHYGVDGITMPGTWRVATDRLSIGYGQNSGRMALDKTIETVRDLAHITRGRIAIKANGGISTGEDVFRALAAGASSVDVLTGLVYRGWRMPRQIQAELIEQLDRHKLRSIADIGPHLSS
ncbi:MAG: dihydroorotate dehydrogenase 2 [Pigmentiphaga sp.]|uniref:dihydroorotate dehydrogenase 2 n=1 Tax=Pigmentiphaga sp. TaxID=1977564 RepID=UPI0029AB8DF6|nr:dihydroorotate dehydrogenase 2 [Pigmentiphaga sp.]MDX3907043.1 dihydroorotate dehydrogenase 2 [Pigmentiphaga sp.]